MVIGHYMEAYSYIEQYYLQRLLAWDEIDRSLKFEMDRVWNGPLYNILRFERFPLRARLQAISIGKGRPELKTEGAAAIGRSSWRG